MLEVFQKVAFVKKGDDQQNWQLCKKGEDRGTKEMCKIEN